MIRITIDRSNKLSVVLYLEGKLAAEAVNSLRRESCRWLDGSQDLIIDLEGVRFIDDDGLTLLQGLKSPRLQIRGASEFIQSLLASYGLQGGEA